MKYGFIDQQAKCGRFSLPQPVRNQSILNYSRQKGGKPLPALFGVTDLIIWCQLLKLGLLVTNLLPNNHSTCDIHYSITKPPVAGYAGDVAPSPRSTTILLQLLLAYTKLTNICYAHKRSVSTYKLLPNDYQCVCTVYGMLFIPQL